MNVYSKLKPTHRHGKQTYGYQSGERKERGQTRGMGLTSISKINNKRLPCSTGDHQYPVTNYSLCTLGPNK